MPSAAIYDCEGPTPTPEERAFFRDVDPAGFILFADHCPAPEDVRRLTDELRSIVGRDDVLILVDQEGGRVARMRPPAFPAHPPMGGFGALWEVHPERALEAARLNGRLIGLMAARSGINVVCAPMLDVAQPDSDPVVIGDRAFGFGADVVAALGRAVHDGLVDSGVLPVIKHLPGHGRSRVDSHHHLPRVDAPRDALRSVDFAPFRALSDAAAGMTAHIVYEALDPDACATLSARVIADVIRGEIGFQGLLFSDDLRMHALDGDVSQRAARALVAGCDIALCCNFTLDEKRATAESVAELSGPALERFRMACAQAQGAAASIGPGKGDPDAQAADYARLAALIAPALTA